MEDQEIYFNQSTYDEEDALMKEAWFENEEDYSHGSYQEELEPKPPDSYLYSLNQHKCYELEAEGRGELLYNQPDHPRSSTWSRPQNTSHSFKSVHLYSDAYHHSTPKIQLYAFSGKTNYLEWERNMDEWFHYNYIRKEQRMKYAVSQLKGEAYNWWVQEVDYRWSYKEQPITTWEHLKKLLRNEFVPRNKTPTTKELPRNKAEASTSSKRPSKETSLNNNEKRFVEALTAKMGQLMDAKLNAFRQDLQPPSESVATNQKLICSKEKPVVQRTEKEQPLLICKGMSESSNSAMCANEIFRYHGKEKDANENPMVLEESAENNTKEKQEVSDSLQVSDQNETPSSKGELLGERSPCEVQEFPPEEVQRNFPLITELEQLTSHAPELKSESLPHNHPKHCKETSLFDDKPILFVLVSAEEEKRFGLEKVKEFCVSEKDFDKMISNFKTFKLETLFKPKQFGCSEFESSLRDPLNFKTFSKGPVFDNFFVNLTQFDLFAIKRKPLIDLCSMKDFCVNQCLNAILSYDLNDTFTHDYTDIICLSLSKEPNAGFHDLKRPRRTYKREEDKRFKPPDLDRPRRAYKREEDNRFKPPDLDQDKHQDLSFFQLVKEAPPDLKPSLNIFGGTSLSLHSSINTNLVYVHADGLDLRTNPFQEGGDDVILTSTKDMGHEPEIEPAPNWQLTKSTTRKRKMSIMEPSKMICSRQEPGSLREFIGWELKATAQPARPSTLVLILAY